MGLFSKIAEAKYNSGGVFFEPGGYLLEVSAIKTGKARKGNRPFFVAEFNILESTCPTRPVGTSVSWMVMLDQYEETALGNIKGFVSALFGISADDVDEAGVEALVSEDQPGTAKRIRAAASMTKTKAGKDFTKVIFSSAD